MNVIRSITLAIPSSLMPTAVLVIDYCDREHDLAITGIELHKARPSGPLDDTKFLGDFSIDQLDGGNQELIYAALTLELERKRRDEGRLRLIADLSSLETIADAAMLRGGLAI